MSKTAGLLLPRSVVFSSIGFDIAGGFRGGLQEAGIGDVTLKTESIGLGADDKQIYAACEKLVMEGVTIVAGYVNPTTAEKLEPLFAGGNAVFISLDAGYHFPTSMKKLLHVFYVSLQGALCIRTLTKTATDKGTKKIAFTCSFYDSGYRGPMAFNWGLDEGGGSITYNLITPLKRADLTLAPLATHLNSNDVDGVFAGFCGDMLQDFFKEAAAGNVLANHTVLGSSFVGEEQWLAQSPYPGVDVQVCVPWARSLDNEANVRFTNALKKINKTPNVFSLLGWEAGIVAAKGFEAGDTTNAITALEGFRFESPRGQVTLDATTHQSNAPVYEAIVQRGEDGMCVLHVTGVSPITDEQRVKLEEEINGATGTMTSWFNAYGCLDS